MSSRLDDLRDNCLSLILDYLPLIKQRTVRRVSKRWKVVVEAALWPERKSLLERDFPSITFISAGIMTDMLTKMNNIKIFNVVYLCKSIPEDELLDLLVTYCPRIKKFRDDVPPAFISNYLTKLRDNSHDISDRKFICDIRDIKKDDDIHSMPEQIGFETYTYDECEQVGHHRVLKYGIRWDDGDIIPPNIEILVAYVNYQVPENMFQIGKSIHLTELRINGLQFDDFRQLSNLTNLRILRIFNSLNGPTDEDDDMIDDIMINFFQLRGPTLRIFTLEPYGDIDSSKINLAEFLLSCFVKSGCLSKFESFQIRPLIDFRRRKLTLTIYQNFEHLDDIAFLLLSLKNCDKIEISQFGDYLSFEETCSDEEITSYVDFIRSTAERNRRKQISANFGWPGQDVIGDNYTIKFVDQDSVVSSSWNRKWK